MSHSEGLRDHRSWGLDDIQEPCESKAKRMRASKHICRVPGCKQPLSLYYNWRYRICAEHRKATSVLVDGSPQRFCQLCGKFQAVDEFVGTKVSCEEALRLHNLRRRMNARRRRMTDGQISDNNDGIAVPDSKRRAPSDRPSTQRGSQSPKSSDTSDQQLQSSPGRQPSDGAFAPVLPQQLPEAAMLLQPMPRRPNQAPFLAAATGDPATVIPQGNPPISLGQQQQASIGIGFLPYVAQPQQQQQHQQLQQQDPNLAAMASLLYSSPQLAQYLSMVNGQQQQQQPVEIGFVKKQPTGTPPGLTPIPSSESPMAVVLNGNDVTSVRSSANAGVIGGFDEASASMGQQAGGNEEVMGILQQLASQLAMLSLPATKQEQQCALPIEVANPADGVRGIEGKNPLTELLRLTADLIEAGQANGAACSNELMSVLTMAMPLLLNNFQAL